MLVEAPISDLKIDMGPALLNPAQGRLFNPLSPEETWNETWIKGHFESSSPETEALIEILSPWVNPDGLVPLLTALNPYIHGRVEEAREKGKNDLLGFQG